MLNPCWGPRDMRVKLLLSKTYQYTHVMVLKHLTVKRYINIQTFVYFLNSFICLSFR